MKKSTHISRVVTGILPLVLAAMLLLPRPALASADTYTQILPNITQTVRANNPCLGPFTATLNYEGVIHQTAVGDTLHITVAMHGTALVDPDNPNLATFSGNFSEVHTLELNPNNAVQTFTVTQLGPDGMTFQITFQVVIAEQGDIVVTVLNIECGP